MYNLHAVRCTVRISYLLFALLVAAFITFYPQLDAAGYCGDGGCPEVSYSAHVAGTPSDVAAGHSGVSFVVAALVAVPGVLLVPTARLGLFSPAPDVLLGRVPSPEVPPPRTSA